MTPRDAVRRLLALTLLSLLSSAGFAAAGTALRFSGSNAYVTFGNPPALGLSTFTVETWFMRQGPGIATQTGTGGFLAGTFVPLVTKGASQTDGTNQDANYILGIKVDAPGGTSVLAADFEEGAGAADPGLNHPIFGTTPIQTSSWYHAALTYDGTNLRLYLNGVLEAEQYAGQPPRSDSIQPAALATTLTSTSTPSGFFDGTLDEVRIWDHARTADEIRGTIDQQLSTGAGLVARWGLDDGSGTTVKDSASSPSAENGSFVTSGGTIAWVPGALFDVAPCASTSSARLRFDGANDYVSFGDAAKLKLAAFTVETWFNRQATGIAGSSGSGGIASFVPLVTKGSPQSDGSNVDANYVLGINAATNVLAADFEEGAGGRSPGLNHPLSGSTVLAMNTWYHAAVTYDGTTLRLYLNGAPEASLVVGQPPRADSIQHAALATMLQSTGRPSTNAGEAGFFAGMLDEARIWDHARTAAEIAASYNQQLTSGVGLVARWGLRDGTGGTVGDSVGPSFAPGTMKTFLVSTGVESDSGPAWVYGAAPACDDGLACNGADTCTTTLRCDVHAGTCGSTTTTTTVAPSTTTTGAATTTTTGAATTSTVPATTTSSTTTTSPTPTTTATTTTTASTTTTTSSTTSTTVATGAALRLAGTDAYVTFGNTGALGLPVFTVETWFDRVGTGRAASTGTGGVTAIPLVTKGRHEADGSNVDMNYFLGIQQSNGVLVADFEEGASGAVPGRNHPVIGRTQIQNGAWHHAAATYDGSTWQLFLDGVLEAQVAVGQPTRSDSIQHAALGSALDSTGVPEGFFDGILDEVRIWNVARSQQDIAGTMNQEVQSAAGLVARWGLNEGTGTVVGDSSGTPQNGTIVGTNWTWVTPGAPITTTHPPNAPVLGSPADGATGVPTSPTLDVSASDPDGGQVTVSFYGRPTPAVAPAFSIVALPDTQFYVASLYGGVPATFNAQTQWIVDNLNVRNIAFVVHLGDCVENGNNNGNDAEWVTADGAIRLLEDPQRTGLLAGIPYGVAVGNHDQSPIGSPDGTSTTSYNRFFGESRFLGRSYYGGHFGTNNDNQYELFSVGGMNFIAIYLEYTTAPDPSVLAWAAGLLQNHLDRRAIVVTHWLVNTGNPASFSAMGQATYDALKTYPNLFLMLGGHVCEEGRRRDVFNGNVVHSLLSDYQCRPSGGNGWLRILNFVPASDQIQVETYSPTLNQFETDDSSQFTLDYQMGGTQFALVDSGTVASGSHATVTWPNLDPATPYEWYAVVSDGVRTTAGPVWRFTTSNTVTASASAVASPPCTAAAECDDADPCTSDACIDGRCVHAPADGVACDDGDLCTRRDVCEGGRCVGTDPVVCAVADQCHAASCDPGSGTCFQTARPDGSVCDDGDRCTAGDTCVAGACVGGGCPAGVVEADLTVAANDPTTNFRTSPILEADASPTKRTFLKVRVDGPEGRDITSAVLRLQVASAPRAASNHGGRIHASGCDWDPSTLTWTNQPNPPFDPAVLASFDGPVRRGQVVEFDVTGAVQSGVRCFAIDTRSTDGVRYDSLESSSGRPELLVSTSCACGTR